MKAYITKITTYLPETIIANEQNRLTRKTGIRYRHIAGEHETAGDLAFHACKKLLIGDVPATTIDFLLVCTQSPDYILPATSCILHNRLGLRLDCGAIDYNHGCSGYVYGLSLAKAMLESGQAKRVLLVTAETYSKYIHPEDNTVLPLFGDAATATLLDAFETEQEGIKGVFLGTDGSGADKLIIPAGAARNPYGKTPVDETIDKYSNKRTNYHLYMNGSAISEFALQVVPQLVEDVLHKAQIAKSDVDYFVLHQANKFMLQFLQEKCGLLEAPYWNNVTNSGNTVSNTIPLALHDMYRQNPSLKLKNVFLAGFGVGLSWGGCVVDLSQLQINLY